MRVGNQSLEHKGGDHSKQLAIIKIDSAYFRPTEVETLLGNPAKAKDKLGWEPEITAQEMCEEMAAYDLERAKQKAVLINIGN